MVEFKPEYRNTIRRGSLPTRPQIAFMTHNLINSYLFYDKYFDSFYLKLKKYFVEIQNLHQQAITFFTPRNQEINQNS